MKIRMYTDGSADMKYRVGAWGCVFCIYEGSNMNIETFSGTESRKDFVTSHRMELKAILEGLKYIDGMNDSVTVEIFTDSKWAFKCLTDAWSCSKHQKMRDGIRDLYNKYCTGMTLVQGHSDNHYNNLADEIALEALRDLRDGFVRKVKK